jgi:electron transfer flavoprotein beta subunit
MRFLGGSNNILVAVDVVGARMLNIIVCVKQVPESTSVEIDRRTGVLKRESSAGKLNPYDLYALEAGLALRDRYGGSLRAITMGPPQAREALLESVYMGADGGVLASDRRFAGSDVLATAYVLSCVLTKIGGYDIILCGKQTTDGDTAQVGPETAEFLKIPNASNVLELRPVENGIVARINHDAHIVTQWMPLPCLIGMDAAVNTPRLPSYRRKKGLVTDPIQTFCLDDLPDRDEDHYGLAGSPTRVERIFPPPVHDEREILRGDASEVANRIQAILVQGRFFD